MSRRKANYLTASVVALGVVLFTYGCAKADWQIQEWTGKEWTTATTPKGNIAAVNVEKTACELDLAGLSAIKPSGTRLRCLRTPRPEFRP
jgi:hypothetical protein